MMSDFVLTSNSDDTLYGRIAADDFKDINSYSQKFDNLSQDMPSTPILAEESVKPVIGNFRLGEVVTPEQKTKQAELDTLETATLATHRGENSKSPLVQMALAGATRSNDMQAVNQVLNSSETTFDEEEALKKVASRVQTDDEKDQSVNKMILDERNKVVAAEFAKEHQLINPATGDMIPEENWRKMAQEKEMKIEESKKKEQTALFLGSAVPAVTDIDEQW